MFLVIPYTSDGGEQLKYALRSWDYYYDLNLLLCGDTPEWFDQTKGVHLARDPNKHYPAQLDAELNIVRGLRVLHEIGITEAIISADDIYLLKRPQGFIDCYETLLPDLMATKPHNALYYRHTADFLAMYNKPAYAYTLHTPYVVDVAEYLHISDTFTVPELKKGRKILPRCVYNNFIRTEHHPGTDYKIYDRASHLPRSPVVSTLYPYGMAFDEITTRYNTKSKWEKI